MMSYWVIKVLLFRFGCNVGATYFVINESDFYTYSRKGSYEFYSLSPPPFFSLVHTLRIKDGMWLHWSLLTRRALRFFVC